MCMGKVIVCCTNKPVKDEGIESVVEQVLECKNPSCASKFSIYWYDK